MNSWVKYIFTNTAPVFWSQDERRHIDNDFAALRALMPAISKGISQRDFRVLIRRGKPKEIIAEEGGVIGPKYG